MLLQGTLNDLVHWWQENGFSTVWILSCFFLSPESQKVVEHWYDSKRIYSLQYELFCAFEIIRLFKSFSIVVAWEELFCSVYDLVDREGLGDHMHPKSWHCQDFFGGFVHNALRALKSYHHIIISSALAFDWNKAVPSPITAVMIRMKMVGFCLGMGGPFPTQHSIPQIKQFDLFCSNCSIPINESGQFHGTCHF